MFGMTTITIIQPCFVLVTEQGEATITQVEIENKTGTELPSTGGMGTTLFYKDSPIKSIRTNMAVV